MNLIDTNVIVRFLTASKESKYKNLYPFFKSLEQGKERVELKLVVVFQVLFVLKSVYQVPKDKIAEGLIELLNFKGIVIREKKIVKRSLSLWKERNAEIVDCYLMACLEKDDNLKLFSYDKGFDRFNVKRIEPQ